ncbi:TlpA family protein disulfide reductase [Georgenia sp. MJ170]|uniref:TlpA family protein disulfide reductase n=1 Tax=Georgenia sunbinii TaxID=3117728 RepID=UPI002F25F1FF
MSSVPVRLTAADLGLSDAGLGTAATLLQISSGFCAPCRAARHVLAHVAQETAGVTHLEVDVAHNTTLAARLMITQTPTVLLLDADGAVRSRHEGVPRLADVRVAVGPLVPAQ